MAEGSGICVVVHFAAWRPEIWNLWVEIARRLEARGQSLLMLSPDAPPDEATWPRVLPMPAGRFDRAISNAAIRPTPIAERVSSQAFFSALLDELDPDVVMAWALPDSPCRLLCAAAQRREIPLFGIAPGVGVLSVVLQHLYSVDAAPVTCGVDDLAALLGRFQDQTGAAITHGDRVARFVDRTALLLAPYVCDELSRGCRAMTAACQPYVEAQLASQMRSAGVSATAVFGSESIARRMIKVLAGVGIRAAAALEPARSRHVATMQNGPTYDVDFTQFKWSALVVASHDQDDPIYTWVKSIGLPSTVRIFGLRDLSRSARSGRVTRKYAA